MLIEIQTHIALFLVDQLNYKEAHLAKKWMEIESKKSSSTSLSSFTSDRQPTHVLNESGKENYLDWTLKVDLKKNKERSIQTSPICINGQSWAFLLDLGNEEQAIGSFSQQDRGIQNSKKGPDERIWFKMSVILCNNA